jgi:hypothetical protein
VNETWLVADPNFSFEGFHSHYLNKKSKAVALHSRVSPQNVEKLHNEAISMIIAKYSM